MSELKSKVEIKISSERNFGIVFLISSESMQKNLNLKVKFRESFRPFATKE